LTPYLFGSVQPYNQVLKDIQTDSSMYNIYNEWFEKLRTISGDLLFMHYAFASPKNGESGSWGALENVNQNPPFIITAPKYQALLDNMVEFKSLQLTVLLQGFYNPSDNTLTPDIIKVYLRNIQSPYAIVDSGEALLNSKGTVMLNFSKPFNGVNYYIQIKHRNSIETWSKPGGEQFTSSFLNYDFTTSLTQAYGNNMILKGSRYCLYGGDVNQDGSVQLSDLIPIYNDATNFVSGNNLVTDLTGDGNVDLTDIIICQNNLTSFINTIRP
ncbi:MAG: dockerin type I domain-containing protein, partial [bacterium]